jgi:hypothetical protein
MSSSNGAGTSFRRSVRVAPWGALLLVAALTLSVLPRAFAAPGDTAEEAIPIGPEGRFSGVVEPRKSLWFRFAYKGNSEAATITVAYEPADSNLLDYFLHTGPLEQLHQEGSTPTRSGSTLSMPFIDPAARDVFIQVVNGHPDRSVTVAGSVTPGGVGGVVVAQPAGILTPTPGPVADTPQSAVGIGADGLLTGVIGQRKAVWHSFWYGNPGVGATVSVSFSPNANTADLNLYTGSDLNNLAQQTGGATRSGETLTRTVNLPSPQFVYFTVVNNGDAAWLAYGGRVAPASAPPGPATTPEPVTTATPAPVATTPSTPVPAATPQAAPAVPHDERYFPETRFRIDNDAIWSYFQGRGQIDTFGFPVSRTFRLDGCEVQIFQRQVAQVCAGRPGAALLNLLDPEFFPYTRVNGSVFPGPDEALKNSTPKVSDPNYSTAILQFVRDNAPDTVEGQPVGFARVFFESISPRQAGTDNPGILGLFDLEVWGAPISRPQHDPSNANFIYQRFQRGVMHFTAGQGTRGILLADYLKAILRDRDLPADLREQSQGSRFFAQYCPGAERWLCRPADMPGADLAFAFEPG